MEFNNIFDFYTLSVMVNFQFRKLIKNIAYLLFYFINEIFEFFVFLY